MSGNNLVTVEEVEMRPMIEGMAIGAIVGILGTAVGLSTVAIMAVSASTSILWCAVRYPL